MGALGESYTNAQFEHALKDTLKHILADRRVAPTDNPHATLLGGQSGAGKSTLHVILRKRHDSNVLIINGDEYRKSHPNFKAIQERYGMDAPAHTAQWSGRMTEALIDALSAEHYNLVIEGTLRTSDVPLKTAALLRERGYSVSLAIMAVKPEISLVSCQIRYELMRIAGTTPRATDPAHHNKIVDDIVSNLSVLEQSDLIDGVSLFDRSATQLYPSEFARPTASDTLRDILFGDWTDEERLHLRELKQQLDQLRNEPTNPTP